MDLEVGPTKENKFWKGFFAVAGIMTTLVIYGVLQVYAALLGFGTVGSRLAIFLGRFGISFYIRARQYLIGKLEPMVCMHLFVFMVEEKIMRVPYGSDKEYFKYSLFLVFCNRLMTSAVSAGALLASKKALDPVAPVYKYSLVSVTNILTTTCQYEALKYVSFPVQTLAKCAKMIPVMVWGTLIMQKRYKGVDYLWAVLVTVGCSVFILHPADSDISPYNKGRESTIWGVSLMLGYLGFDGFTSTFQDKLFKGYNMEIQNQIFYTTLCSCVLSLTGLVLQGQLLAATDFIFRHNDCFYDIALLSTVATASQFFISYTIRTFGALTFATIMTTRQLLSIFLSCLWFAHPLSPLQWVGAVIVFGSLYAKSFLRSSTQKPPPPQEDTQDKDSLPLKVNP